MLLLDRKPLDYISFKAPVQPHALWGPVVLRRRASRGKLSLTLLWALIKQGPALNWKTMEDVLSTTASPRLPLSPPLTLLFGHGPSS